MLLNSLGSSDDRRRLPVNSSAPEKPKLTKEQKEFMERYRRELALRPEVSDEEFMAETEVSEQEYQKGLTLPGCGSK
jgi:hypothetical protein